MTFPLVKLSEVCDIIAGQSPESKYYNQSGVGVPFFQGKADFGHEIPSIRYWCTQPTKLAFINDILLSVRAPVGPTNICNVESCIGRGLAAIRCSKKTVVKYVYWWFKSIEGRLSKMGNGSTFSAITTKVVKDLLIPLPPLHIQQQIADTLDKADALRRKDQELLNKYNELAQSIFYDMFGDPVRNERGWELMSGNKYAERIKVGVVVQPASYYVEKGVMALRSLNVRENYIDKENMVYFSEESHINILDKSRLKTNDVLVVRTGQPGRSAVVTDDLEDSNCIDLLIITPKQKVINPDYLSRFFNSPGGHKIVTGNETGQVQKHLNVGVLNKTEIPVPPIRLQNKYSQIIKQVEVQKQLAADSGGEILFNLLLDKSFV